MVINLSEKNSIILNYLAEIRDVNIQKDRMRFRRNIERIGEICAYEISKTLTYQNVSTETPLGISESNIIEDQPIVGTILRAGLPLHQGILNVFDKADNAFVSAYRKHHKSGDFEIRLEYVSCPNVENKVLILCDPMLATGASIVKTIKELYKNGMPTHVHIVAVISSVEGIEYLERNLENYTLWTAAIDDELTAKGYIVPGLGDAGDLAYGEKMQN